MLLKTLLATTLGLTLVAGAPAVDFEGAQAGGGQLAFEPSVGKDGSQVLMRQTEQEAAIAGRKMILDVPTGTLATTFPASRSDGLAGSPFAMMEYQAPHPSDPSSLLLILMPISTSTRNILEDEHRRATFHLQNAEGRMSEGRVSLIGNVTVERDLTVAQHAEYAKQYLKYHPDAAFWLPSNGKASPHESWWARLDPTAVYAVMGFGDTKYIGPIGLDLWKGVKV